MPSFLLCLDVEANLCFVQGAKQRSRLRGTNEMNYVSYFKKKERQFIFDAPVKYSELKARFGDRNAIAAYLCMRCNIISKNASEKYDIDPLYHFFEAA